jgi:triosephosphate isomerase
VGETLKENESNRTEEVVRRQISQGLQGIDSTKATTIIIAYEPIWAIGTGLASSGENANSVVANFVRPALADLFGAKEAQAIRVQYGGSVTSANADEFFTQTEIDGALVGGASLKADEFVAITQAANKP